MKIKPIGIDLGTTYSAIATIDDSGNTVMIHNSDNELLTPSVVLFEQDEIIVGREAKRNLKISPDRVADCAKRDMGHRHYHKKINDEELPPEVIQSCILRKLKEDAIKELKSSIPTIDQNELKAVITVPAYFDEPRRKSTMDAGFMAGLEVIDIVNEPTAAALAYGEQLGFLTTDGSPKKPIRVLVYDLGGGTFDVTIVNLNPQKIQTLAIDGDVRLGGRDWDQRLVDYAAEEFQKQHQVDPREDPSARAMLFTSAEEAKHTLSARSTTNIRVEHRGVIGDIPITREKFESLTADLLERTAHTTRQVIESANLTSSDIDRILLVGGSTRMPMVTQILRKQLGISPDHGVNPDEAVARGAAKFASYILSKQNAYSPETKWEVKEVSAHSLGIEGVDIQTRRKQNKILIPRNSPLPAKLTKKFVTHHVNQKNIVIKVLEGESKTPQYCSNIGRAVVRNLPENLTQGWPIMVTYSYDTNGRLSIEAKVRGTSNQATIHLEREHNLSDQGLSKWKEIIVQQKGFDAFDDILNEVLETIPSPSTQPATLHTTTTTVNPASESPQTIAAPLAAPLAMPVTGPWADSDENLSIEETTADNHWLGYTIAILLGLILGYYGLCLANPEANFLNLPLPGVSQIEHSANLLPND